MPESSESTATPDLATDVVAEVDGESAPGEAEGGEGVGAGVPVETAEERLVRMLAEKEEALRGMREQMLRMQADFENYKRRQQNSLDDEKVRAREGIIGSLLPVLDNFERALQASGTAAGAQGLVEGCQLILRQARDILSREGLTEIEADGQIFDPTVHEAVMREDRDDVEDQTIMQTLQKGYRLGTRVLRPSMVKVAVNTSAGNGEESPR